MDPEAPNLPVEVVEELCRKYREDERLRELHKTVAAITLGGVTLRDLRTESPLGQRKE